MLSSRIPFLRIELAQDGGCSQQYRNNFYDSPGRDVRWQDENYADIDRPGDKRQVAECRQRAIDDHLAACAWAVEMTKRCKGQRIVSKRSYHAPQVDDVSDNVVPYSLSYGPPHPPPGRHYCTVHRWARFFKN